MIKVWKEKEKFLKATLTLLAAFLMFAGPTYLLYILQKLGVSHVLLVLFALASFTAGVILVFHLTKEETKIGKT